MQRSSTSLGRSSLSLDEPTGANPRASRYGSNRSTMTQGSFADFGGLLRSACDEEVAVNQADVLAMRRQQFQQSKHGHDSRDTGMESGCEADANDGIQALFQEHTSSMKAVLESMDKKLDQLLSSSGTCTASARNPAAENAKMDGVTTAREKVPSSFLRHMLRQSEGLPSGFTRQTSGWARQISTNSEAVFISESDVARQTSKKQVEGDIIFEKVKSGDTLTTPPPKSCQDPISPKSVSSSQRTRSPMLSLTPRSPTPWMPQLAPCKPCPAVTAHSEALAAPPMPELPALQPEMQESKSLERSVSPNSENSIQRSVSPNSREAVPVRKRRPSITSMNSMSSAYSRALVETQIQLLTRVRQRRPLAIKIWMYLEDPETVPGGRQFVRLMTFMILTSVATTLLQTMESSPLPDSYISAIETAFDIWFTIETLIRFCVCPNRLAFFTELYNYIDLVASVLPLLLRTILVSASVDLQTTTMHNIFLCVLPVTRLLKLLRRFESFHLLYKAFVYSIEALPVLLFTLSIIVLGFASLLYVVEPRSNVESLSEALWLTIVTVGTIGYGDVVPSTTAGNTIASCLIIVSALYMAMPIGIIGNTFSQVWGDRDRLLVAHRTRRRFLATGYTAHDIPAMFINFDQDGDGVLSFQEFSLMMSGLQLEMSAARLVRLFSTFDVDGTGTINDNQFACTLFPAAYAEIYSKSSLQEINNSQSAPDKPSQITKDEAYFRQDSLQRLQCQL